MLIQILHTRDPDSECGVTVYLDGARFTGTVEVEDIDPGRGYDDESIQEAREHAQTKAGAPGATEFSVAVAEAHAEARYERFSL